MKRAALAFALLALVALTPASPVLAHGGNGGSSGDYGVTITGFTGDRTGIELRSVEFGNRMEIRRTTAHEVMVLGYSNEPYLRLDTNGVWENFNSPAHYLNRDRFASTSPPESAKPDATPNWKLLSSGSSVRWHDHRTHWMGSIPPVAVQANPDVERVIFAANPIPMTVDGRQVSAIVQVTWLPPPSKVQWLIGISLVASAITVALTLIRRLRRPVPVVVIVAALGCLLGQGFSITRVVIGSTVLLIAVAAALMRRPLISVAAAGAMAVLSASRLEVFEHMLIQGAVGGRWQRVAIASALVIGLAVVSAQIIAWLSPNFSPVPQRAVADSKPTIAEAD